MSTPLNVVALSGGTSRPSRTLALTEAILAELAEHLHIKPHLIELGDIARPCGAANCPTPSSSNCVWWKKPTCWW